MVVPANRPATLARADFFRSKIEERLPQFRKHASLTNDDVIWLSAVAYLYWQAGITAGSDAEDCYKAELASEIDELLKGRKGRRGSTQRMPCSAAAVIVFELATKDDPILAPDIADHKNRAASVVEWLVDHWAGPDLPLNDDGVIDEVVTYIRSQGGMGAIHRARLAEMNAASASAKAEIQKKLAENEQLKIENAALRAGKSVEEYRAEKAANEKAEQERKRQEKWEARIAEGKIFAPESYPDIIGMAKGDADPGMIDITEGEDVHPGMTLTPSAETGGEDADPGMIGITGGEDAHPAPAGTIMMPQPEPSAVAVEHNGAWVLLSPVDSMRVKNFLMM